MNVQNHGGRLVHPRRLPYVLRAVDHRRDVRKPHRRSIPVSDDDGLVFRAGHQLIVRADGEGLPVCFNIALGQVHVRVSHRRTDIFEAQPVGGQRGGVGLNPYSRPLAAADAHQAHAGQLRNLLPQRSVGKIFHLAQRHGSRRQRQNQNRRIRRIRLAVDRRVRKIRRQVCVRCVDGRLHLLLRHIDI